MPEPHLRPSVGLRRGLRLWQVIGLSVGLMAPSLAININPQGAVGAVGRAIPLSFAIALAGALLVAYGFARLSQHFDSAGSALALAGATLGPRAGTIAGWCLAGTYVLFALITGLTAGLFATQLLHDLGLVAGQPDWLSYCLCTVTLLLSTSIALAPVKRGTAVIVSVEGVTVTLILVAAAVVLVDLLGHRGPGHLGVTSSVFVPARSTSASGVFLGVVFGLLSFGGFEGAATLGEEAARPRRDVPAALLTVVFLIGAFYVSVSAIEVMGFGTTPGGLSSFTQSPALMATLGRTYVAGWFGDLILVGTVISAFGCCSSAAMSAARILMSMARCGLGPHSPLAGVSDRTGVPVAAVLVVTASEVATMAAIAVFTGAGALTAFVWSATVSTFLLMTAYGLVTAGALAFLFVGPARRGEHLGAGWAEAIIPFAGLGLLVYTIYRNLVPFPTGPSEWLPVAAAAWIGAAVVFVVARPGFSRALGAQLMTDFGGPAGALRANVRREAGEHRGLSRHGELSGQE